ncbi:MAG: aldolase [Dehalococcoidales bacterium]|jgi:fructose/tagatose bisphosphate aldolase|nr:aldolase [Dehalococcoidales bacterium]MDP6577201.1 class II fructose-bisphosphate aldolase [Dehalococcoidales bacterium]
MSSVPENIDTLVDEAVFATDSQLREKSRRTIRELAAAQGIFPASIQGLYEAAGQGHYGGITVPAINIRGITYQVARAVFRAAQRDSVGAFIFEIARSETGYTGQRPDEYTVAILAAAIKGGFCGPVFIQGDHFQVSRSKYGAEPEKELNAVEELVREAVSADFLNIDIDASTLVDLDQSTIEEQQAINGRVTADMTNLVRSLEPKGVTISVGGEIGEIGKGNSTVEDLRGFMAGYLSRLGSEVKGISKISVQTGTAHGGVVLPDGTIAKVKLDFKTLEDLSRLAREEFGMGGAVQHGASTLPDEAFDMFPRTGTLEVHLATGFQNLIYDSPFFPGELLNDINRHLSGKYADERKEGETEEQFRYKTRKKAFGDFKKEMWHLPAENLREIREMLEKRFSLLFHKLNVTQTKALVDKYVANSSSG